MIFTQQPLPSSARLNPSDKESIRTPIHTESIGQTPSAIHRAKLYTLDLLNYFFHEAALLPLPECGTRNLQSSFRSPSVKSSSFHLASAGVHLRSHSHTLSVTRAITWGHGLPRNNTKKNTSFTLEPRLSPKIPTESAHRSWKGSSPSASSQKKTHQPGNAALQQITAAFAPGKSQFRYDEFQRRVQNRDPGLAHTSRTAKSLRETSHPSVVCRKKGSGLPERRSALGSATHRSAVARAPASGVHGMRSMGDAVALA